MKSLVVILAAATVVAAWTSCESAYGKSRKNAEMAAQPIDSAAMIERGAYLVNAMLCDDCHTPKTPDMEFDMPVRLSGHRKTLLLPPYDSISAAGYVLFNLEFTAMVGPWGTSFGANLTPHATGIEAWSIDNFKTVMRKGKYKGLENGRDILPPMPWKNFSKMTDADLEAIFAFLKSLPPVDNLVPAPIPPAEI